LEIVLRTTKPDNTPDVLTQVFAHLPEGAAKIAYYQKDQSDGELTDAVLNYSIRDKGMGKSEMKEFMEKVHMQKIRAELDNMEVAAKFVKWTFDNIVNEVEDIIDAEKKIKHSQIQGKVEKMAEKPETIQKFLSQFPSNAKPDSALFEYPIAVLIQSGTHFTVNKFNMQSDTSPLNDETIYVNVCGKYRDMNVMASRTLLVNPDEG
jgi:nucleosome binding factor SPN SPT16 subunit